MAKMQAALDWAARGFPVFPLRENTREPAFGANWTEIATTDAATIRAWWTDPVLKTERDYNIGSMCNDLVVIDVDVKKGKDGYNQYLMMGGSFETLVVRTTTGGFHCYFYGPDSSNEPLDKGVDVRSHNGYVVAPGSIIDGNPYIIERDRDMAWVPSMIEPRLKPPYVRSTVDISDLHLDTPAAIDAAIRFLESTDVAIEGNRGDETTFITAARLVREMALSAGQAFFLMRDYWNDRCIPPWSADELLTKVSNASQYGTADLGKLTPENLFGHLDLMLPPTIFDQTNADFGNAMVPFDIRPRPWLLDKALMLRAVTLLLAAGSAGKSTISLALAAHLALGKDFAGYAARHRCKTIIYNGEDDVPEQSRRLLAVCMAYGFDYNEVKKNILLLSPREIKITLVAKEFNKPVRNDLLIKHLTEKASAPDVGLVILDPLVKVHACDESDNVQMDYVMETLTDLAHNADVAVLVLHHTTKNGDKQESRIGNMDIARGASAVVNAARIAFTLLNASQQDAEDYGMRDEDRHTWVRLDDAKMNMTLADNKAVWFRKEGVKIPSMDIVGVLRHEDKKKSKDHIRSQVAETLIGSMAGMARASLTMPEAVATVKATVALMANKTDIELRKRIEGWFMIPATVNDKTISCIRNPDDTSKVLITLT